jgi:hypothetical protein
MNSSSESKITGAIAVDSIGSRIIAAARLAATEHLVRDRLESSDNAFKAQAMIGGTGRLVTDDNASVVSGSLPVVEENNN